MHTESSHIYTLPLLYVATSAFVIFQYFDQWEVDNCTGEKGNTFRTELPTDERKCLVFMTETQSVSCWFTDVYIADRDTSLLVCYFVVWLGKVSVLKNVDGPLYNFNWSTKSGIKLDLPCWKKSSQVESSIAIMEQKIFVFIVSILVIVLLQMIDTAVAKGDPRECEGEWNVSAGVRLVNVIFQGGAWETSRA